MKAKSLPPPRAIYVDVDDTLISKRSVNRGLIAWIRAQRTRGSTFVLWSMRGETYAREIAARLEVTELFDHIVPKPGYMIDDSIGWTKKIRWLSPSKYDERPFC